jgi:alpha-ribazole phosphatase
MTRIWLVRHGPTHQKTMTGWRDVPADLSDTAALSRLADYLPQDAVIVSSDLMRAHDTAAAVTRRQTRLADDDAFRELHFGAWDGLHHTEVSARDPVLSRQFWEEPGDLTAPDGESWNALTTRVGTAIDDLIVQHSGHIIVVAHMGVIMSQIPRAGGTAYLAMGHQIAPLSVTDLILTSDTWQIGTINHIA